MTKTKHRNQFFFVLLNYSNIWLFSVFIIFVYVIDISTCDDDNTDDAGINIDY